METHRDCAIRLLREELVGLDISERAGHTERMTARLEAIVDAIIAAAREPQRTEHEQNVESLRRPMFDQKAGKP